MNILIFIIEALFVGIVAFMAWLLAVSYIFDLILVFTSSGIAVIMLLDNPTIALIVAIAVSVAFHIVRHTDFIRGSMLIITSILLGISVYFFTSLMGDRLLAVVNTAIAVGINIYERFRYGYTDW